MSIDHQDTTSGALSDAEKFNLAREGTAIYRASLARLWGIDVDAVSISVRLPDRLTLTWGADESEAES